MKKLVLIFTLLLLCLSMNAQSQNFRIGDYLYTNTTSSYGALSGDSTITLVGSFDTGISDAINIVFPLDLVINYLPN